MRNRIGFIAAFMVVAGIAGAGLRAQVAPSTATKPATPEERLRTAAANSLEAIVQREQIAPFTPEFIELHHLWSQRLLEAELALAKDKPERVDAAQKHLTRMNGLLEAVKRRLVIDADKITLSAAEYHATEAELILARESK